MMNSSQQILSTKFRKPLYLVRDGMENIPWSRFGEYLTVISDHGCVMHSAVQQMLTVVDRTGAYSRTVQ